MELTNELMFSYFDTGTNEIKTVVFDDVSDSSLRTDLKPIPQKLNLLQTGYRQHNWNPDMIRNRYGWKQGYVLNGSANTVIYEKSAKGYSASDAVTHINYFGTYPSYYLSSVFVNNPMADSVSDNVNFRTTNTGNTYRVDVDEFSTSDLTLYQGVSSDSNNQIAKITLQYGRNRGTRIRPHVDLEPSFGAVTITDNFQEKTLQINFPNNNVDIGSITTTPKLIMTQAYNQSSAVKIADSIVDVNDFSMIPTWDKTLNRFNIPWGNLTYKERTGNDGIDDDFILSGELIATLYDPGNGGKLYEETIDYYYSYGPDNIYNPIWLDDQTIPISGYVNDAHVYQDIDQTNIDRTLMVWYDEAGTQQTQSIDNAGYRINFWQSSKRIRGKAVKIRAYYQTMAGLFAKESDVLCPVIKNYYNIKDLTLTLSGIKYDSDLSTEVGYEIPYLKEVDDVVLYNKFDNQFQTITETHARVDFTLAANTTDIDGDVERIYCPAPEQMWLVAVPKSQKNNTRVNDIYFDIQSAALFPRESIATTYNFPKCKTLAAEWMVNWLDSETPNIPTSGKMDGIMFNTEVLSPIYEFPSDGNFVENTYTIKVDLLQDSWAFYLIIKDSTDQYTGYCISNPIKFEVPSRDSFDY